MDRRISNEPFLPGDYIREAMEARGWTQDDLANVMGRSRHTVLRLIGGHTAVTAETAHELAKSFDTSAELWMNLQVSYELAQAKSESREIERRANVYRKVPVRDLVKRGRLPDTKNVEQLEEALCRFLRIPDIDSDVQPSRAARKSTDYGHDTPEQIAWFCIAREMAEAAPASRYDERKFEDSIQRLLTLAAYAEDARRVPRALSDMGIRFVVVEHLPKTKIDGVAFWINDSPAVALSMRYDRIDNFWFNLIHELVHIKHRDDSSVDMDLKACSDGDLPAIEQRANAEACNYLIPNDKIDSFLARNGGRIASQAKIVQFAHASRVHPGIVVGLMHGRQALDWKYHRKLLAPVRAEVTANAVTDGWCHTQAQIRE